MKKVSILLSIVFFYACNIDENFPTTEFYVKNTSDKVIKFEASVMKQSELSGPQVVSLSFIVNPNEIVLARKVGFAKDGKNPQSWFKEFIIHPVQGIQMNDPNLSENWIKDDSGVTPVYVFTLNKN